MLIKATCPMCGDTEEIYTPTKNYVDWKNGELIQNAMPFLDVEDRERLMTGFCSSCYDSLFKDEEE